MVKKPESIPESEKSSDSFKFVAPSQAHSKPFKTRKEKIVVPTQPLPTPKASIFQAINERYKKYIRFSYADKLINKNKVQSQQGFF
jgi:hypothetical protein